MSFSFKRAFLGLAAAILIALVASQCASDPEPTADPATTIIVADTVPVTTTTTEVLIVPTAPTTTEQVDKEPDAEPEKPADQNDPDTAEPEGPTDPEVPADPDSITLTTVPADIDEDPQGSESETPGSDPSGSETPDSQTSQSQQISLSTFDECSALLEFIKSEALERVGPYGLDGGGPVVFRGSDDMMVEESAAPAPSAAMAADADASVTSSAPQQGVDFSGTNVQVEGVDEADIVKTDGTKIVGVNYEGLWIADISATDPRLLGRVSLQDGSYQEMYLSGDRVFAIGYSSVGIDPPGSGGTFDDGDSSSSSSSASSSSASNSSSDADDAATSEIARPYVPQNEAVVISEIDISDPENPTVVRHLRIEGSYISSRAASGQARVVIRSRPDKVGFVRPDGSPSSEASALRFNRLLIQESEIDQWLPQYNLHDNRGNSIARGQLLACDRVYAPSEFSGFNQISVVSFPIGENLSLGDAVSTMAGGETVYASPSNLYVSHHVYDPEDMWRWDNSKISIHKFALNSDGTADYEASGSAEGSPINQYAFHEYDGRLFVATTTGGWRDSESFVTALEQDDSLLEQVGKVGNLGRGEQIYAVRYIGTKAYVVTFRQTDPLYVIDISDPTNPTTEGELKITGYSAYLHPVGEDLLLGVGREATDTGRVTGAKVSLFDVSDPANPSTLDTLFIEDGSSEVEWDARAFLWWAPEKLAVVPLSEWENNFTGAIALSVSTDSTNPEITMRTRISHDIGKDANEERWGYDSERRISRSMVIGDNLWTLSNSYLQANSLETLDRRAWVDIPD